MDKVRFGCPRCQTIMQTAAEKVGFDVACPNCAHRFRLVESNDPSSRSDDGRSGSSEETRAAPDSIRFVDSDSTASSDNNSPRPTLNSMGARPFAGHGSATFQHVGFSCPYCQTTRAPRWKSEVSTIGWVVFAVLLVSTCFFCFVGLFIRDSYRVCSQCKIRLS